MKHICVICSKENDYISVNSKKVVKSQYPSVDHIVALANGGTHSWDNVRLAHFGCNASKGVKAYG